MPRSRTNRPSKANRCVAPPPRWRARTFSTQRRSTTRPRATSTPPPRISTPPSPRRTWPTTSNRRSNLDVNNYVDAFKEASSAQLGYAHAADALVKAFDPVAALATSLGDEAATAGQSGGAALAAVQGETQIRIDTAILVALAFGLVLTLLAARAGPDRSPGCATPCSASPPATSPSRRRRSAAAAPTPPSSARSARSTGADRRRSASPRSDGATRGPRGRRPRTARHRIRMRRGGARAAADRRRTRRGLRGLSAGCLDFPHRRELPPPRIRS